MQGIGTKQVLSISYLLILSEKFNIKHYLNKVSNIENFKDQLYNSLTDLCSIRDVHKRHWIGVDQAIDLFTNSINVLEPIGELEGKVGGGVVRHYDR